MLIIIAIIVGGVLGVAWSNGFGALIGAVLGWLLVRSFRQEQEISELQQSLKVLRSSPPVLPTIATVVHPTIVPDAPAPPVAKTSAPTPAEAMVLIPRVDRVDRAIVPPPLVAPVHSTAPAQHTTADSSSASTDSLAPLKRWLFGGNTIVKVGVGILFIGLAFLAKFASENVYVAIEMRLAAIGAVALVLLGLGWRLRHHRPGYAQALQGGAVAMLYLTLFVAFRFYGVFAAGSVFALMVVIAALAAALAVLQNSPSLAVIGALGGFATPLLVSTGNGDHVALFSYYLVLDLGIATVAWYKTWRALNLIGFIGTFVVGTAWGVLKYGSENYASSQSFLIAFFLLFIAIMLMPARHHNVAASNKGDATRTQRSDIWVNGSLLFGLPTITFALQHGLVRHTEYGTAISALVLAGFYVLLALLMRSRPRMATLFDASLAISTVFLTLVIPFALDARSTAGAWALEGAGLVWLGFRQSRGLARAFGYALLVLSSFSMWFAYERFGTPLNVLNTYFFNALMAAAASLTAAYFVHRFGDTSQDKSSQDKSGAITHSEAMAEPLLIGLATLWLVAIASLQIDTFVTTNFVFVAGLACISGMALLYTALSVRLDWPTVALPVMAHTPVMVMGVVFTAATLSSPMQDGGWWAWPLALFTHAVVLWRATPHWSDNTRDAIHALGVLVLAALGALQGRAITADWGDTTSAWAWLGWLVVPAMLLMWLPRPAAARRWPVSAAPGAYQMTAAVVLMIGLLIWTLLANIVSNGSAQPLPYVPLLNPLDLGMGVALLAAWLWLRSEAALEGLDDNQSGWLKGLFVLACFMWLNAMLIRSFHHYGDVPFLFDAWIHSLAVQTGITLLWAVTALVLMWWSARRAMRFPWMGGATLLGAVVLKLLLVDLSGSGTIMRIVSFIGVGVLMLIIGYVAPLPAKEERHS